ncbi:MAG: hypothetical protein ACK5IJ_09080 [Mangrovibacterium sp.]
MKISIKLTDREWHYLTHNLLKEKYYLLQELELKQINSNNVFVNLEEELADEIRELAGDEVGLHFDENYIPTKEGEILESIIDKFFTG